MRFSIIIPVLNEANGIVPCLMALQKLRQQSEIIVVDGGSKDQTVSMASQRADVVLSAQRGRASQMNQGAGQAVGEVLIFLHADTFLPETALQDIGQAMERNDWGRFDIQLQGAHRMLKIVSWMMNWRSRMTGIATGDQVIFIKKQLFEQAGGYPEIALMEDIAISRQLKRLSAPVCLRSRVISSGRRWEQFGVFKTIMMMWALRARYFFGDKPEVLAELYSAGRFWKNG